MINRFNQDDTNVIIDFIKEEDKAIDGLIFETTSIIVTNTSYAYPPIMSEARPETVAKFIDYSYNIKPGY